MKAKYIKLSIAQNYYKFHKKLDVIEATKTRKHNVFIETKIQDEFKIKNNNQLQYNHKNTCIYNYDIINGELSDELSVDHLLFDSGRAYVRPNLNPNIVKFLKFGKWRIEASLDLHSLCIESARSAFINFIGRCIENNVRCICIIHGKGYGSSPENGPILKGKVRSWLVQTTEIRAFSEAAERNGGSGALIVLLRKIKNES
ncbi:small MutS-related protein [Candidatus Kinetoplastibacterium oncopeltii TCC290E]|uniref:Small MutS-related protein n=2 Tax=Candidatus Kinetoplastidibacterium stringomonadis TaxID=994696 RepID=M1LSH6_9PROT|nr:small MutS-related protein [Candidatus Kinetoplastibacterium oncopeltii TCC290E]